MFEVRKIVLWALTGILLIAYLIFSISQNLKTERNTVAIFVDDPEVKPSKLSVAVVGDIHLPEGSAALDKLHTLLREIKFTQPDLVVFVGDYTASLQTLAALRAPVDAFFDDVMVNAEEMDVRLNRQGLLKCLHVAMNRVADLSRLAS